jgi:hypothetical protein
MILEQREMTKLSTPETLPELWSRDLPHKNRRSRQTADDRVPESHLTPYTTLKMSIVCPLQAASNTTVIHPAYFPPLGSGSDSVSYAVGSGGEQLVSITAQVRIRTTCLTYRRRFQVSSIGFSQSSSSALTPPMHDAMFLRQQASTVERASMPLH